MENTSKTVLWIVVVLVVVLGAYYFMAKGPSETGPIKIGMIGPLTGDAAVYGEVLRDVVKLAVEEINADGGINGRQVEGIYEDGKCSGAGAASAMQKLVNADKVKIVIGGFCSSESLAAVPIATQNKVFLFSPGSSSPDLTNVSKYFARNYPSDASQGSVLAGVAYNQKNWRKIAFIQEQLDYPLGIFKAFSAEFEKMGGKIVKEEFSTSVTDFRSQLTKLKAENPDALFIDTQTPAAADRILKQLQDLKWRPALLVSDATSGDSATVKKDASILEGALAAEFGVDPANQKYQHHLQAYKEKYGKDANFTSYTQTIYDSVYMIRDAVVAVGYDGTKVANWVRSAKDWPGASGLVTIKADGDRAGGHVPKVIKNGKVELLK